MKKQISVVLTILFFSCSNQNSNQIESSLTELELEDILRIEKSHFEIVDLIPFETTSENLMGNDLRIRSNKDYYFVFDEGVQDCVHQFEKSGKYLGRRAIVGEGPNTITRLSDFFVAEDGKLVVLNSLGDQAEVLAVDVDNSIQSIFKVDYIPSSFTKLPSGDYLFYGSYNLPFVSHRLIRTDSNGVIQEKYLENQYSNKMLPMTERNFFKNESDLFVVETFNNIVFQLVEDELKPIIKVDFGNLAIPAKFWELNLLEGGFDLIQQNGFANFNGFFKDDKYSLISLHVQKPSGIFKNLIITNQLNGAQSVLETSLSDDYFYHYPVGIEGDEFLFVTYQSEIKKEKDLKLSVALMAKIPDGDFDYPVLMKVKFSDATN
ncbi:6-bladed beta-propeller [Algoriphagus marinus]|uniref:6-bladed beta-propeller n=1 Tax=Algoriphagus marinus TaxID=1925762 RepID=UPI00094B7CA3|nr:6-bladed beta-propeller [Algoriphagus marinus]